jgi:hypothetical protein
MLAKLRAELVEGKILVFDPKRQEEILGNTLSHRVHLGFRV